MASVRFGSACFRALLLTVALAVSFASSSASSSASAETAWLHCGRDGEEGLSPSNAWYSLFRRRVSVSLHMKEIGNHELAKFFEDCSIQALRNAAELGHREAQYRYGLHLVVDQPYPNSRKDAYWWIKKAADRGHENAQLSIKAWPDSWR